MQPHGRRLPRRGRQRPRRATPSDVCTTHRPRSRVSAVTGSPSRISTPRASSARFEPGGERLGSHAAVAVGDQSADDTVAERGLDRLRLGRDSRRGAWPPTARARRRRATDGRTRPARRRDTATARRGARTRRRAPRGGRTPGRRASRRPAARRGPAGRPSASSSRMKRAIHPSIAGDSEGRIHSGPDGLTSHRSDSPITPGPGTGIASDGVIQPAFPAEAPPPQRPRSTTIVSAPRLVSASAIARPTAPPPTTTTGSAATPELTARSPRGTGRSGRAGTGPSP